jgi:transcriptional regulator with XRE-family HTH domain
MPKKRSAPVTFSQHLGAEIEARFGKKSMGQEEIALCAGWSTSTVGRKIRGESPLLVSELLALAEYLNVPSSEIVDQALKDFGGIDKLLSVGREDNVLAFPHTKTDYDEYTGKRVATERDDEAVDPEDG